MGSGRNILAVVVGVIAMAVVQGVLINAILQFFPDLLPDITSSTQEWGYDSLPNNFLIIQFFSNMLSMFCAALISFKIAISHHKQVAIGLFVTLVIIAVVVSLSSDIGGMFSWHVPIDLAAKGIAIFLTFTFFGKKEDDWGEGYIQGEGGYIENELGGQAPKADASEKPSSGLGGSIWSIVVGLVIVARIIMRIAKNGGESALPIIIAVVVIGGIIYFFASKSD